MHKALPRGIFIFMMLAFAVYALTGVFSKMASEYPSFSSPYLVYLGGCIAVLGVYAIMWQIILKNIPLSTAFLWKNVSLVFYLLYSRILFGEAITFNNIFGIGVIMAGLCLISREK